MSASGPLRPDHRGVAADGVDAAPPPVVRAALDQIANTRQRRELTIMRRIHNMDGTAVLNQRPFLKPALIGLVGLVALIAIFGLLRFITNPEPNPAAPVPATRAEQLVMDLPAPLDTAPSLMGDDTDAITALVATTREETFGAIPGMKGVVNAAALKFNGVSTGRPNEYVASAITFESADDAASAISAIKQGLRLSEVPDGIPMWAERNRPPTEAPARRPRRRLRAERHLLGDRRHFGQPDEPCWPAQRVARRRRAIRRGRRRLDLSWNARVPAAFESAVTSLSEELTQRGANRNSQVGDR